MCRGWGVGLGWVGLGWVGSRLAPKAVSHGLCDRRDWVPPSGCLVSQSSSLLTLPKIHQGAGEGEILRYRRAFVYLAHPQGGGGGRDSANWVICL